MDEMMKQIELYIALTILALLVVLGLSVSSEARANVTVAIVDSGIGANYPVIAQACFCFDCCPNGPGDAEDDHGHGTLMTSYIAAVGVQFVAVKVLNNRNKFRRYDDLINALRWIINTQQAVQLVNISLSIGLRYRKHCDDKTEKLRQMADAINKLRARGVLVIASSGNNRSPSEVSAPACIQSTIAVGAVDDNNVIGGFVNSGIPLDLLAYSVSGTSSAAARITGCAAQLLIAEPGASADRVEWAMMASGKPVRDERNGLVFPRVDCGAALALLQGGAVFGGHFE